MLFCKSKMILWILIPIVAKAADDFDYFFEFSDDPHPTDVLIDQFAHTIQLAHGLSSQLKDRLSESGDNKELKTLAIEVNDKTGELSSVMTQPMIMAMKEAANILRSSRTCQDLANLGITQSGRYKIDPDGPEKERPIEVYCNFTTNTTEIAHNQTNEVEIEKNLSFGVNFDYQVPMGQVQALIDLSEDCEQSIRFDCFLAPLMSLGNEPKGSWKDQNGNERTFFHGNLDTANPHQCQCGVDQTCVVPKLPCNCDAKLPDWQVDEGTITDKNFLPMTGFTYGPMKYDLEQARISIGSLKCSGRLDENVLTACPEGWTKLPSVKGKCYKLSTYEANFADAEASCLRQNAKLAEPTNDIENRELFRFAKSVTFWIGVSDRANEGR